MNIVKLLFEYGQNVDSINPINHLSPLSVACINNNVEIVKFLLSKLAPVNGVKGERFSPIVCACKASSFQLFDILIKKGAKYYPEKCLDAAFEKADSYRLIQLLIKKVSKPLKPDYLNLACKAHRLDIVKLLFDYGADVNQGNPFYYLLNRCQEVTETHEPEFISPKIPYAPVVEAYLECPVEPNIEEEINKIIPIVKFLLSKNPKFINYTPKPIEKPTFLDFLNLVNDKDFQYYVSTINDYDKNPLICAYLSLYNKVLLLFLQKYRNSFYVSQSVPYLFLRGCEAGDIEFLDKLLAMFPYLKSKINNLNKFKPETTPLGIASKKENITLIQYLISKGVLPKAADVYEACLTNNMLIVNILLNQIKLHTRDPKTILDHPIHDEVNCQKTTILSLVVAKCNLSMVKLLVDNGASVDPDVYTTPLFVANLFKKEDIKQYLIEKGATQNHGTYQSITGFNLYKMRKQEKQRQLISLLL